MVHFKNGFVLVSDFDSSFRVFLLLWILQKSCSYDLKTFFVVYLFLLVSLLV